MRKETLQTDRNPAGRRCSALENRQRRATGGRRSRGASRPRNPFLRSCLATIAGTFALRRAADCQARTGLNAASCIASRPRSSPGTTLHQGPAHALFRTRRQPHEGRRRPECEHRFSTGIRWVPAVGRRAAWLDARQLGQSKTWCRPARPIGRPTRIVRVGPRTGLVRRMRYRHEVERVFVDASKDM